MYNHLLFIQNCLDDKKEDNPVEIADLEG